MPVPEKQIPMRNGKYIFLSILFGCISTLLTYIGYGVSDHVEQLPMIYRLLDGSFLSNDFFTNVNANSLARIHYSKILAFLSGSERNLPLVFMLLTYISNISVSIITFYFGRMIFNKSDMAGILASAIVMVIPTFELGYFEVIYSRLLTPSTIATPMALGGIMTIFQGNLLIGVILCCLSSFVQPLIGLEMAGLLLFTYSFNQFIEGNIFTKKEIVTISLSLFTITTVFIFFAIPQFSQAKIKTDLFIYITAYFRHPHHYIPSTFRMLDYVKGVVFVTAILVISHHFIRLQNNPGAKYSAMFIYSAIVICIGGYVFVELIPVRIWVIAQVFRLLFFVKWVGLVLFAGMLVESGTREGIRKRYLPFMLNPLSIAAFVLSEKVKDRFRSEWKYRNIEYVPAVVLLVILYVSQSITPTSIAVFSSFMIAIYLIDALSFKKVAAASLLMVLLFIVLVFTHKHLPVVKRLRSLNEIQNSMKLDYNYGTYNSRVDVEKYALLNMPEESVFLTPPNWGEFRLLARRAIVVDFKAFPFSDKAMEEWYNRMLDCYGNPRNHGFEMIPEMNQKYKHMNDEGLKSLQTKVQLFIRGVICGDKHKIPNCVQKWKIQDCIG